MAEVALYAVIMKLGVALGGEVLKLCGSLLIDEVSSLTQLPGSMSRVKSEFLVIYAFLNEIDLGKENKTVETWLEEVRKLAYRAEDVMDEFLYLTGQHYESGRRGYVRKIMPKSKNVLSWHRVATQLKDIEMELEHLSKMKDDWIMTVESVGSSNLYCTCEPNLYLADYSNFVDGDEIVGIAENKKVLTAWLAIDEPSCSVISVWGMGGLGKTTLVTTVYKTERKHFDCHAWVSVSQTCTMEGLLRSIIMELSEKTPERFPTNIFNMDHRRLKENLRSYLEGKRCLIILDDVWSPKSFQDISDVLVDNECRSKLIITTRIAEVASLAADNFKLQLKILQEEEAWELFCARAFWKDKNRQCPAELQNLARKIMLKCQGLPLAITSIGSFLSLKEGTESEWRKFNDQLSWELDNNPNLSHIKKILNLSYKCLPRNLKNCFLYCSIFPKDCLLKRKKLIRQWIAEGFVEERGTLTREDVAEDYLKELTHRCMLQVIKRNEFGRIKGCQLHELVRELAISISRKENFKVVCDNTEVLRMGSIARRLSLVGCDSNMQSWIVLPQLRSFLVFGAVTSSSLLSSVVANSRYLTVLHLEGVPIKKLPGEVCNLFNLQYLCLRGTKLKMLPRSLGQLHKLQTLDILFCEVEKLPDSITKLKNLRHLFLGKTHNPILGVFNRNGQVQAPSGLCNLESLQTLLGVDSRMEMLAKLGKLTQLRSFRVMNVKGMHCAQLCNSIAKMHFLSNLEIFASEDNELLQLASLPPLHNLQKLYVEGWSEGLVKSPLFQSLGHSLRSLSLGWSKLTEDPLPSLSHMANLAVLRLCKAYDGQSLNFRDGWFPYLKELWLVGLAQLKILIIEKGAIVNLDYLYMNDLGALKEVTGIHFLTNLQRPYLTGLAPEVQKAIERK